METLQFTVNLEKQQIINLFRQLKSIDKKEIFEELKEDFFAYLYETNFEYFTITEYNQKLEKL